MIITLILIELRNLGHFLICKSKIEDVEVIFDMVNIFAAGDDYKTHLSMPTENNLCTGLACDRTGTELQRTV